MRKLPNGVPSFTVFLETQFFLYCSTESQALPGAVCRPTPAAKPCSWRPSLRSGPSSHSEARAGLGEFSGRFLQKVGLVSCFFVLGFGLNWISSLFCGAWLCLFVSSSI